MWPWKEIRTCSVWRRAAAPIRRNLAGADARPRHERVKSRSAIRAGSMAQRNTANIRHK